jgi:ABC-type antimicrobial peptide transport system permease subunit
MIVLSAFAALAVLLTGMGTYGVISYVVSLRSREIGIRVALGADPSAVMRGVLGSGARLTLGGAVVGIFATVALTRYLASLLFGVSPTDVPAIGLALVLAAAVALAATFVPARRAARIDPALTLRND